MSKISYAILKKVTENYEVFYETYRKDAEQLEAQGECGRCFEAWYPSMDWCVVASIRYIAGNCI